MNDKDLMPGVASMWCDQGVWNWKERAESITFRELKAIRKILQGTIGQEVKERGLRELLVHVDNQAVVYITNSFVTTSRPLMRELRRLKVLLSKLGV